MTPIHDAHRGRAAAALAGLALALGLAACGGEAAPGGPAGTPAAPVPVQLALNWFPEAEHGGFYAAEAAGLYAQEGLAVEILKGGPGAPVIQQVATGRVAFGIANADVLLLGRAQGADAVAVMAPIQVSPRCVMVHAASGIRSLAQLEDVTLAASSAQAFFHFMKKRLPLEGVTVVPYPGNVAQFLLDPKFAQQAYVFSEPYLARSQGADPVELMVSELGFNPYTSVLVVGRDLLRRDPGLVGRMVRASVAGWERYLADPAPAHARIHALHPEMTLDVLDYGARALGPLVRDPVAAREGLGHMSRARWAELVDQLVECGLVPAGALDPDAAFDASFLAARP